MLFCKSAVRLQSDLWKIRISELGVRGAAIATVIARIAEVAVVMAWAHSHTAEKPFIRGVYRSFHVPMDLVKEVIKKGTPLLLNETLWAGGMAMLVRCYSSRDWWWLRGLISQRHYPICSVLSISQWEVRSESF